MPDLLELHVLPDEAGGTWTVGVEGDAPAFSAHGDAAAAQRAARRLAAARGARRIHLHDRYQRVHTVSVAGRGE